MSKREWLSAVMVVFTSVGCGGGGTTGVSSGAGASTDSASAQAQEDATGTDGSPNATALEGGDARAESRDVGTVNDGGPAVEEVALPNACDQDTPCGEGLGCYADVCLAAPAADEALVLTNATGLDPYPAEGAPNLSCIGETVATPAGPDTVTLYGAVTRFGSGLITKDVRVEVFLASEWDPSVCEGVEDLDERLTCYANYGKAAHAETYGIQAVGASTSVGVGPEGDDRECEGHEDCELGYECIEDDVDKRCFEQFGLYEIEGIPTNTPLVIRSRAMEYEDKWHDVYMFGVYLYADQATADGRFHYDVTMVSHGQWLLTANTAGLGDIPLDKGVVGGRVRDCRLIGSCAQGQTPCTLDSECEGEDICEGGRASWPLGGVTIGLAQPAAEVVYFNNLEDDTVPLDFRTTTNILGRYAALDIPAGWNRIAGVARLDDEVVSVGGAGVYVVPNALSIIGWPGYQPHWKQE